MKKIKVLLIKINTFFFYLFFSRIIFLFLELYLNRKIRKKIKNLKIFYKKEDKLKKEIIYEKLKKIVFYSYENNSFYRSFYDENKVDVYKINKDIKFFQDFPELTKNHLIKYKKDIVRTGDNTKFISTLTGGSTGPSVRIYYDTYTNDCSSAVTLFCRKKFLNLFDSQIHFASKIHGTEKLSIEDKFKSVIFLRFHIFFEYFDNNKIKEILDTLKLYNPVLVHCHPSIMYMLANYILDNNLVNKYEKIFKIFESSGETLENYMKKKIESVFKCKIINRYGLAEFGIVAYQFNENINFMNVLTSDFFLEKGKESDFDNKFSEIIITSFNNYFMPLIKYNTGDFGSIDVTDVADVKINEVKGRVHDYFLVNEKKIFTHTIQDFIDHKIGNIREFQINSKNNKKQVNLVLENIDLKNLTIERFKHFLPDLEVRIIKEEEIIRKGQRQKFRHII